MFTPLCTPSCHERFFIEAFSRPSVATARQQYVSVSQASDLRLYGSVHWHQLNPMGGTIPPGNCLQPANNNCFRPRAGRAVVYLVEQRDGSLVQQLTTRAAAPHQALQQSRLVSSPSCGRSAVADGRTKHHFNVVQLPAFIICVTCSVSRMLSHHSRCPSQGPCRLLIQIQIQIV